MLLYSWDRIKTVKAAVTHTLTARCGYMPSAQKAYKCIWTGPINGQHMYNSWRPRL